MTRFPLLPPPVHPSIHPRMRSRSHSACVHLRVPLVPRAQSSSAAGPGQVTQPQGVPGCHSACTSSVIVCLPGAVCSRCSECPSPHRPRTWWPLPASCRHSPPRGYLSLAGRLPHVPGSRAPTSMQKSKCDFRLDGLRWGNVSSQGLSTCSPVRCSIGTASLPANPVLSPAATPHTSSLGAHASALCSWSSGLPLPPEWSKVFELTGPHCMSPSVRWYLGPGTSGIIFVGFLLGLKVLLLMGFTVTHICRWRSL